jgi:hypothetical protein
VGRERGDASERTHHEERVRECSKRRERRDASIRTHHEEWGRKPQERGDASERTHHEERVRERSKRQERGDASIRTHHKERGRSVGKERMHARRRMSGAEGNPWWRRGCILMYAYNRAARNRQTEGGMHAGDCMRQSPRSMRYQGPRDAS